MPGRPLLQKVNQTIDDLGGEEWVWDQIADGASIGSIAEQVGCSRSYFYAWVNQHPYKERRKAGLERARRLSAEAHVEHGLEILDELADPDRLVTATDARVAEARASYRQWLGKTRDREQFGDSKAAEVQISIGSLHLEALRSRGAMGQVEAGGGEVLPAEVVEDDEDDVLEALR